MILNWKEKKKVNHQHLVKSFLKVSTSYESEKKNNDTEIQNWLGKTTCKAITVTTSGL